MTHPPKSVGDCAATMAQLLQLGANHSHAMQLYESFSVRKTTLAAFLISRGPSAAIVLQPYDRPMVKTPFTLEGGVDPNADPGNQLQLACVMCRSVLLVS